MLEIKPVQNGFIVFDTDQEEAVMRFDSHDAAADLVADLVMVESREQLRTRQSASERLKFYLSPQPS